MGRDSMMRCWEDGMQLIHQARNIMEPVHIYCINNPISLIDINGEDSYEYDIATRQLTWINDVGESEKIDSRFCQR